MDSSTEPTMPLPERVAMWCREAGLDDDARHAFLEAFSKVIADEPYASAKDVPHEHVPMLRNTLDRLKNGEIVLHADDPKTEPFLANTSGARITEAGEPVPVAGSSEGEWDAARWKKTLESVPGVGPGKLVKHAREVAGELEIELPNDLDGVTDGQLVIRCLTWLREQKA